MLEQELRRSLEMWFRPPLVCTTTNLLRFQFIVIEYILVFVVIFQS